MPNFPSLARRWPHALLFVLVVAALASAQWSTLRAVNHEVNDFAANSLLVMDAKRLQLIYGNYSRIGFNHPGPAILYVLAAGELLFHDLTRLVPSPLAGQMLAADLYAAAWVVLILVLARRMAGALLPALLFTAVALAAFAHADPGILNGMWFPHLYVLPFAVALLAIAPLVLGRADTLAPLAVAGGFLVNGHASFMPILALMLATVLAANVLVSRDEPALRILSRAWLGRHRRALLAALGILFLFLVPLLIATVKDFPGPLYDYLKFSRRNPGHTVQEALRFIAVYWSSGPAAPCALLLALLLLAAARGPAPGFAREARALGIVFVGATLAVLYYVKVGVDLLDQPYIALFYYAVPVLATALLVLYGFHALAYRAREAIAGALALLALGGMWQATRKLPEYAYFYDHENVVTLYESVRRLPGKGRVVLDLRHVPETWGEVWGNTLGLLAYAKRQGVDLACVNEGWHISFTRQARCRPEEVAGNRRYLVLQAGAPDPVRGEPAVEAQGLALFHTGEPPLPANYITIKEQPEYFRKILGRGWARPAGEFVWSEGRAAELHLPADPRRGRTLTLDLGSFVPTYDVRLNVHAYVNGNPAGAWGFYSTERRRRITLDLGPTPGAAQHVELKIDNPISPLDYGISQDPRLLGVSLYGMR